MPGRAHIHGHNDEALVHVAAVDAPLTASAIDAAVDECAMLKQRELHVLGWDWEIGRCDLMVESAAKRGQAASLADPARGDGAGSRREP